jgi:hypothetical protein
VNDPTGSNRTSAHSANEKQPCVRVETGDYAEEYSFRFQVARPNLPRAFPTHDPQQGQRILTGQIVFEAEFEPE